MQQPLRRYDCFFAADVREVASYADLSVARLLLESR